MFRWAFVLSIITIAYNIAEGAISTYLGYTDEALTLFGFGVDSFIEVLSGVGITLLVLRTRKAQTHRTEFEISALRLTGWGFYILSVGLAVGIAINLINGNKPETTIWGIVISAISIITMIWMISEKRKTGRAIGSDALIADAQCNLVCVYMSVTLLLSSGIFYLTQFAYADAIGSAGLIWFSVREGREAFGKAKGKSCGCGSSCHN